MLKKAVFKGKMTAKATGTVTLGKRGNQIGVTEMWRYLGQYLASGALEKKGVKWRKY